GHGRYAANHDRICHGAQIDIKVFELGAPVRPERKFGAGAKRPAARRRVLREARSRGAGDRGAFELDAADRIAAGDVSEPAISRITDAAARGAEPVHVMLERGGRRADGTLRRYAAFRIAPVEIAFDARDEAAGLPIEAGLNAAGGSPQ